MDGKLKDAIAAARMGDKESAQRQLTDLLDEDPQQVQGWYLLSLLVDSPQKQAAYLSKTLALNPNHEKAKTQMAALRAAGTLAPTSSIVEEASQPMDVLAQSESDELPSWLREADDESEAPAVPDTLPEETAVSSQALPDWLKEPAALVASPPTAKPVEEGPTLVGKTAEPISKPDKIAADLKKTLDKPQPKPARPTKNNARNLNILLGLLVTLAAIVLILLAYLLLS